ncbi:hypothetical protein [Jiangella asiatica]|uniref:Uncharacterized protein n=1 Tax=Jiangella asiatica TaxID=2530372 RepID=A0A4R5CMX1_9ACTN|nr:hypothetical protein [Jiangella asiatica]TDD98892.1 hypothetical protein E1269_28215 [Jiangella asiatica]
MSTQDDLTTALTRLVSAGEGDIGFRSGIVTQWETDTGHNAIVIAGTSITGVPFLMRTEALAIQVGDVVGVLRVKSQYFVLGRISTDPGEIVVRDGAGRATVRIRRTSAGGGEIVTYHPNGVPHMIAGQLIIEDTGEIVGQGLVVQQDDRRDLFGIAPPEPNAPPIVRISDHEGVRALATDAGPAGMLDRPYMDVPVYPVSSLGNSSVDSTAYTTVWLGRLYVTHPALHVAMRCWCAPEATGGAVRVLVGGHQLGSTEAFSGTTAQIVDLGPRLLPDPVMTPYGFWTLELQLRRTGGSGLVIGMPYSVTKRGTP